MTELAVGQRIKYAKELGTIAKKQGNDFVARMDSGRLVGLDANSPVEVIAEAPDSTTSESGKRESTPGRRKSRASKKTTKKKKTSKRKK